MPALTSSIDNPGRAPYQSFAPVTCNGSICFSSYPVVPAGHRLVIQHVSGTLEFGGASITIPTTILVRVGYFNGSVQEFFSEFFASVQNNVGLTSFDQSVLGYIEAGASPEVQVNLYGSPASLGPFSPIALTGYLLDCTASPCAPIAQ
jgi:hypothetical protein